MNALSPDLARSTTQRLIEAGETWSDLDAAASALEETAKSVLGKLVLEFSESMPTGKAEHAARASEEYQDHVARMVEARRKANRARVRWIVGQSHVELMRSMEATRRSEMNLR